MGLFDLSSKYGPSMTEPAFFSRLRKTADKAASRIVQEAAQAAEPEDTPPTRAFNPVTGPTRGEVFAAWAPGVPAAVKAGTEAAEQVVRDAADAGMDADRLDATVEDALGAAYEAPESQASDAFRLAFAETAAILEADLRDDAREADEAAALEAMRAADERAERQEEAAAAGGYSWGDPLFEPGEPAAERDPWAERKDREAEVEAGA